MAHCRHSGTCVCDSSSSATSASENRIARQRFEDATQSGLRCACAMKKAHAEPRSSPRHRLADRQRDRRSGNRETSGFRRLNEGVEQSPAAVHRQSSLDAQSNVRNYGRFFKHPERSSWCRSPRPSLGRDRPRQLGNSFDQGDNHVLVSRADHTARPPRDRPRGGLVREGRPSRCSGFGREPCRADDRRANSVRLGNTNRIPSQADVRKEDDVHRLVDRTVEDASMSR